VNNKDMKKLIKRARKLAKPFRVTDDRFRLKDIDPDDTLDLTSEDKPQAKEALATGIDVLAELQDMLYAQDNWAVLLIFQAMDAAGKDGAIKHVMSGVNPQGCQVFSFKAPTSEDLDHDYLWRCIKCLPERGRIGVFNRSYYEETLVVRVHREFLEKQKLPAELITKDIWKERFQVTASPSTNFFFMSLTRSRRSASSNASRSPKKTGSFPPTTPTSANTGTITWPLMKT
jgi:polyphosphate kinase 2 (PPK2 family)